MPMQIVPYAPIYKDDFIQMNLAWISEMFSVEPEDERELYNIEEALEQGGEIFFAVEDDGAVMACCMIAPRNDIWEILKFTTKPAYRGSGAGRAVLNACIEYGRKLGLPRLFIVTNDQCTAAIHLYRRAGFVEIPVDKELFPFARGNLAFKLEL